MFAFHQLQRPAGGTRETSSAFWRVMSSDSEGPYFASREEDERTLSREAIDWRVAAAHHEMADRYEALAAVFGEKRLSKLPIDYL